MALLETGLRCNNADISFDGKEWSHTGEPTEAALVVAAHKAGLRSDETLNTVSEFSFNSSRKRMTVMEQGSDGLVAHVKGAPEVILERCSRIMDHDQETVMAAADRETAVDAYLNFGR